MLAGAQLAHTIVAVNLLKRRAVELKPKYPRGVQGGVLLRAGLGVHKIQHLHPGCAKIRPVQLCGGTFECQLFPLCVFCLDPAPSPYAIAEAICDMYARHKRTGKS